MHYLCFGLDCTQRACALLTRYPQSLKQLESWLEKPEPTEEAGLSKQMRERNLPCRKGSFFSSAFILALQHGPA